LKEARKHLVGISRNDVDNLLGPHHGLEEDYPFQSKSLADAFHCFGLLMTPPNLEVAFFSHHKASPRRRTHNHVEPQFALLGTAFLPSDRATFHQFCRARSILEERP